MPPLVSAIMPTANRRKFVPQAIACFLSQDWPNKELIILDDGDDAVDDLAPAGSYSRSAKYPTLGAKRNAACELAKGEFICHFDDDDHSEPHRITDQIERLLSSGKAVTGYHSLLFYSVSDGKAYRFDADPKRYVLGTSLCYRRDWWKAHPFPDKRVGEDNGFFREAMRGVNWQLIPAPGGQMMVARIHEHNTSPKSITSQYKPMPIDALPEGFPR